MLTTYSLSVTFSWVPPCSSKIKSPAYTMSEPNPQLTLTSEIKYVCNLPDTSTLKKNHMPKPNREPKINSHNLNFICMRRCICGTTAGWMHHLFSSCSFSRLAVPSFDRVISLTFGREETPLMKRVKMSGGCLCSWVSGWW